jgi:Zn-dependent protease
VLGTSRGIRLGRIAGVEVHVDWSLLLIFALIAVNLGAGVFPRWHPGWSPILWWGVALSAAVLFFGSILAHELSHAIVGNARGARVRHITLFMFGGMAHLEGEPPSPRSELLMTAAGPLTSLVIGFSATLVGLLLASPDAAVSDADELVQGIGPVATLLLWLGPINILLALFNLVPGFPLDGGRLLRALLWWLLDDRGRATRWAANVGRLFAWVLITSGALMIAGIPVPIFGVGLLPGLWLVLIGWFLLSAATASYQQERIGEALRDIPVSEVMRSRFAAIDPGMSVRELVHDVATETDQRTFPVVVGDRLQGIVRLEDVRSVPYEAWHEVPVASLMTRDGSTPVVGPDDQVADALTTMGDRDAIPVVQNDHVVGLLRRHEIQTWLELRAPR